jgi:hypothetical protein
LIAVLERVGSGVSLSRPRAGGRRASGLRTYTVRARVRFERRYPYVLGYSRRTHVTVG